MFYPGVIPADLRLFCRDYVCRVREGKLGALSSGTAMVEVLGGETERGGVGRDWGLGGGGSCNFQGWIRGVVWGI